MSDSESDKDSTYGLSESLLDELRHWFESLPDAIRTPIPNSPTSSSASTTSEDSASDASSTQDVMQETVEVLRMFAPVDPEAARLLRRLIDSAPSTLPRTKYRSSPPRSATTMSDSGESDNSTCGLSESLFNELKRWYEGLPDALSTPLPNSPTSSSASASSEDTAPNASSTRNAIQRMFEGLRIFAPVDPEAARLLRRLTVVSGLPDDVLHLIFEYLITSFEARGPTQSERHFFASQTMHPKGLAKLGLVTPQFPNARERLQLEPAKMLYRAGLVCGQWYRCAARVRFAKVIDALLINPSEVVSLNGRVPFPDLYPFAVKRLILTHPNDLILRSFRDSRVHHLDLKQEVAVGKKYLGGASPEDPWKSVSVLGGDCLKGLCTLRLQLLRKTYCSRNVVQTLPALEELTSLTVAWSRLSIRDRLFYRVPWPTFHFPKFTTSLTALCVLDETEDYPWHQHGGGVYLGPYDEEVEVTAGETDLFDASQQRHFLSTLLHLAPQIQHLTLQNWQCDPDEEQFFKAAKALKSLHVRWTWTKVADWRSALVWLFMLFGTLSDDSNVIQLGELGIESKVPRLAGNDLPWIAFFSRALNEFSSLKGLKKLSIRHGQQWRTFGTAAGRRLAHACARRVNPIVVIENDEVWPPLHEWPSDSISSSYRSLGDAMDV